MDVRLKVDSSVGELAEGSLLLDLGSLLGVLFELPNRQLLLNYICVPVCVFLRESMEFVVSFCRGECWVWGGRCAVHCSAVEAKQEGHLDRGQKRAKRTYSSAIFAVVVLSDHDFAPFDGCWVSKSEKSIVAMGWV